jgi:uncharacterized protein (TIGR02246 family)
LTRENQAVEKTDLRAEIGRVIEEMTEGFNKHDGNAVSRMYAEDARLTTVRGEVMRGRGEIAKGLSAIFASRAKQATLKTLAYDIVAVTPDVALAYVTNELSGLIGPDGQGLPPHQELSLRVFVKQGGSWVVKAFHNTIVRPARGGTSEFR